MMWSWFSYVLQLLIFLFAPVKCLSCSLIWICIGWSLCPMYTFPHSQLMLYMPGVFNPTASLTTEMLGGYFLRWHWDASDIKFGHHSTESSIGCLRVWYVCHWGWFVLCLICLCWPFHGSAYVLGAVSIAFEHDGKEFQFLVKAVLITYSCGSVYKRGKHGMFVGRMVVWIMVYIKIGMSGLTIYSVT
jgi:hypothetical protein